MIDSSPVPDADRLAEGIDRATPTADDAAKREPNEIASELVDVLKSTDALLRTIDLERVPEVIDVAELPGLVDLDRLGDAISERDPDLLFDTSDLRRVVDARALWNAVDLREFATAKRRLEREVDDVLGETPVPGVGGDSEAVADVKSFAASLRPDATQALLQQEATAKLEPARDAVVERHEALERQYASNARRFDGSRGGRVRNPTAFSLRPPGPLPDSISTRLSTVPAAVPNAKIDPLPRIFGRRWREASARR